MRALFSLNSVFQLWSWKLFSIRKSTTVIYFPVDSLDQRSEPMGNANFFVKGIKSFQESMRRDYLMRWITIYFYITSFVNTFKYHVFAPMGRFHLELIYLYFPPSSHLIRWKLLFFFGFQIYKHSMAVSRPFSGRCCTFLSYLCNYFVNLSFQVFIQFKHLKVSKTQLWIQRTTVWFWLENLPDW